MVQLIALTGALGPFAGTLTTWIGYAIGLASFLGVAYGVYHIATAVVSHAGRGGGNAGSMVNEVMLGGAGIALGILGVTLMGTASAGLSL